MADDFFETYESVGNREDLIDVITNISPTDTPMLSRFGRTSARATYHEWQKDSLADASSNKVEEGKDVDAPSIDSTTRVGNYTQILRKSWRVTDTQEAVDKAGRDSEYEYQMAKHMKELAKDIEYAIVNGSQASGATGTAREMKGVLNFISTNVETGSGAGDEDLDETMYNDLLETIWNEGGDPDVTYAPGPQKRAISNFTANSTRNIGAESNRLTASVDVYESDFGLQTIIADRYIPDKKLVVLEEEMWKTAYLRPVQSRRLPDDGGGPKGKVEAELTLEALNEASSGKITELNT
jgi:hypothetical protein